MASRDLDLVLKRITNADLRWAPREGMRTVAGQLLELANKEREGLVWLREGVWPDGGPDAFDPERATLEEIKAALKSLRADTFDYIDSLSEAELCQPMRSPERWWEALRLEQCPKSEVLRNIAAHEWYHTGQLITYLWLRGDNPDNW
ncbi:DinB family protein [Candidatus Acetothermia bacterium]|nr:DinB family protein [Candidatus Acetothermia bacterium]